MMAVLLMVLTFDGSQRSYGAHAKETNTPAPFLEDLEVQESHHHHHGQHCDREYLHQTHHTYSECICMCRDHHCHWYCEV